MDYPIADIARILKATSLTKGEGVINQLLLDSRKVSSPAHSLFFAIKGSRRDGHQFINDVYKKGVRNFVVSTVPNTELFPEAEFLQVPDTLVALQQLTAWHRSNFDLEVIGITGSNGKTVVKEWLYQLLQSDYHIVRSPKSYNSQIGVPLSVWNINKDHTLGIFEAGISLPGEMEKLEQIIRPSIGIITNIGEAHSDGFESKEEKLYEKLKLFRHAKVVIHNSDDPVIDAAIKENQLNAFSWGTHADSNLRVLLIKKGALTTVITFNFKGTNSEISIPFTDDASIHNALTCCSLLLYMDVSITVLAERIKQLQSVNMRLEYKKGINHCSLINDSYSADLSSLEIALDFLEQQGRGAKRTVILSDLLQTAFRGKHLYESILENLVKHKVNRLIGIGEDISEALQDRVGEKEFPVRIELFASTEEFLQQFRSSAFHDEVILVKGARKFGFEKIIQLLEQKVHQTVLEINLNSIVHNLKQYQRYLDPSTKIMAMVKAFAYGSGGAEIAGVLQFHKVDYLGVAYADEGVELRRSGITLPVMVMNPEESSFDAIIEYNLEPELYSFQLLQSFDAFLKKEGLQQYPVHIEIESGMNRLGFEPEEIQSLSEFLSGNKSFRVQSVFTHLSASEEKSQDEFTIAQFERFEDASRQLETALGYSFLKHISNSAAILRHPKMQLDMVRLGIGLYGVDSAVTNKLKLQTVATLRSTIAQIKQLSPGDSVSYNRRGKVDQDAVIATIRIGYADGYPRRLGNGVGRMVVAGHLAPVIGNVCMDMTMIDITGIPNVREGDDVVVFGQALPVQQLALWAETIPYEIMTGISQRVKRIYYEE